MSGWVFEMGFPESVLILGNIEKVCGVRAEVTRDSIGRPYVMPMNSI